MRRPDPTLPRYGTDFMTLRCVFTRSLPRGGTDLMKRDKCDALAQALGHFENLFWARTHPIVFREVQPPHSSGRIHQKLGRPGNVLPVNSGARVQQIIAANHFGFRIRKKRESVAGSLTKIVRNLWSVDADCNRTNPCLFELSQTILNAPKLGVA